MLFLGSSALGTDYIKSTYEDMINFIRLSNMIINDIYVTTDANHNNSYESLAWDMNTVFWCMFQNNLLAGNIMIPISSISSIRIKVREYGTSLWTTIYEYDITTEEDFNFAQTYYFLKGNKTKYEIAIVPVLNGIESNYITNTVISDFDGCYMCTKSQQYHAFINLSLEVTTNHNKEFITTLGRAKPFAISNGLASYDTISMSASFIPMLGCQFDIDNAAKYRKEINKFLTDKQVILLKDDKGSRWLVSVDNSIPQTTSGHPDNIIYDINFTEVGDCDSTTDLYINGLSDIDIEGV